jgi:hypothetical protein
VDIWMVLFLGVTFSVPGMIARRRKCEAARVIDYWSRLALAVGVWLAISVDKQMQRNEVAELGVLSQFEFTDFVVPVTATLVAVAGMIAWASFGKRWATGSPPE